MAATRSADAASANRHSNEVLRNGRPDPLAVSARVERVEHVGGELRGFLEDRRDGVRRRVGVTRKPGDLVESGQVVQHELHFGEGGMVRAHAWVYLEAWDESDRLPAAG